MLVGRRALLGALGVSALARGVPLGAVVADASAPPLPLEYFAEKPVMSGLLLSPDGSRVLARIQAQGKEMLGTYAIATGALKAFALPEKGDLHWYRWAGDNRFLVSIMSKASQRGTYKGTMEYAVTGRGTRLVCFDTETEAATFIGLKQGSMEGDDVVFVDPDGEYLLLSARTTEFTPPRVYRIALKDNDAKQLFRPMDGVHDWYADDAGVVRAGLGQLKEGWFLAYRSGPDEEFRKVGGGAYDLFDNDGSGLMAFASGTDEGYILSNRESGFNGVYKYNFRTGKIGAKVFASPANDVQSLDFAEVGNALEAIRYTDDRERVAWIDPLLKEVQDGIDRAMAGRQNRIVSRSRDNSVMLVHSGTPSDPGTYYVFHLANQTLKKLVAPHDKLPPARLSGMEAVRYTARDGLEIPAYLTLPAGRPPKGLPLVILPHGGPYGVRDTLRFDPEVQFLASRGYAVLQPNYRGSESYGLAFHKRGEGEWGRKMQDDLDDGMDWLVGRGIVDPKRACLVGSSYGGYAAAWGATRNPERYRCAASFAGVFDLRTQLGYTRDFLMSRLYRQFKAAVRGAESFDLNSVSPLREVKRLQVPVLLIHGDDDSVVPVEQSKDYAAALKKAGKPHELHIIAKEGHGFREPGSFAFYLGKLEAFLKAHNPA